MAIRSNQRCERSSITPDEARTAARRTRAYRNEELSIGRLAEMLCDADGRRRSIEAAQEFVASYQAPSDGDVAAVAFEDSGDEQGG